MRLGTCIALEVVTGLVALGGASLGTAWAVGELRGPSPSPRAATAPTPVRAPVPVPDRAASPAATPPVTGGPAVAPSLAVAASAATAVAPDLSPDAGITAVPVPGAIAPDPAQGPSPASWAFAGQPDEPLLAPLRDGKLVRVKFNRGGTSLSLRLDFDNGARAAFKPEQIHLQSQPRREIAAYRIDRILGIGRVPPAIGRTFTFAELEGAVDASQRHAAPRLRTEAVARRGLVRGELSWWVPVLGDMYVNKQRIDSTDAIVQWRRWLKVGAEIPEEYRPLCEQLSAMTLFDFVIDNTDRWTGNNAKSSEDGGVLYFMDNTLSFSKSKRGSRKGRIYLERVQTFSRRLVARLRRLQESEVRAAVASDTEPFDHLLTDAEIAGVMGRRDAALEYVDALIAEHGEEKVLVFP